MRREHLHITTLDTELQLMAATQKLYPRGTVKRIVKAHSNRSVSKNADILVCLNCLLLFEYANPILFLDLLGLHAICARVCLFITQPLPGPIRILHRLLR
jgi:hypothetical protein